ncbi:subunit of both the NuA4 histone H4 acetyltransferase complex and the SWR1 complex [Saitoella complicata NRRL Y-17804]|uniref:subunit of both the NuA4 histone H4 acetyltransferase complex and the SWR1 complex n=1 Tax=Saitoella complicata (strain BCRC 22490 / CBS 7301 / JCM 7358 / NBRC 10748 / NRRL Y-17804) TaxID=698492 RepID=UPI0008678E00|nr:subunit of both the NuA4 histone H4 acetyltransferase complex and the SWR1 complex [Saitoella complicata NRRL Y-17804]ODQ50628.1 subunit of both the NuA4 histone H4 acetyltransferase complex and the SWR1 complex [Saitoella complicata NRRL Y-17804]
MAPPKPPSATRLQGVSIMRPIVYGNTATLLNKDQPHPTASPDHTHEWTISVQGVNGEDISYFVKKVMFKLHDTYANSMRTVESPPFAVTETGWGEFDIAIKVFFVPDPSAAVATEGKPLQVYHHLKLHPYGPDAERIKAEGLPVSSWSYDEVIFNEPTEAMWDVLKQGTPGMPLVGSDGLGVFSRETEQEECDRLQAALMKVSEMTRQQKNAILEMERAVKREMEAS